MSLRLYKASAGSGKTYQMAVEIVVLFLKNPDAYKHTLAITFTNKAAGELKTRIIDVLTYLSALNNKSDYLANVRKKLDFSDTQIQEQASHVLNLILHNYSRFSVSTIDKFFNRILTGFSYEVNIRPDSEISLDDKINREEALDEMLSDFDINEPLGKWLLEYTKQKLDDSKDWNIRKSILGESDAIAKEDFLTIEDELKHIAEDKTRLVKFRKTMHALVKKLEQGMKAISDRAEQVLDQSAFTILDFSHNVGGALGFIISLKDRYYFEIGTRAMDAYEDPETLISKGNKSNAALVDFAVTQIHPLIVEMLDYHRKTIPEYNTAKLILLSINDFGVFLDLNAALRKLCQERNIYFPSQMSQLLHEIVVKENAMFVYEKIGTRYLHFMLDEFQDTSRMQWDILKPLLQEGLSKGGEVMVVGDVKQSIFRWRNGDWNILSKEIETELPAENPISLHVNFRSRKNIVEFNNALIKRIIPAFNVNLAEVFETIPAAMDLSKLYSDFEQTPNAKSAPYGYVQMEKLPAEKDDDWRTAAMDAMVDEMHRLFSLGYSAGDMAVLTRKNKDAGEIAVRLMKEDQKAVNLPDAHRFPIVSADSLVLSEHPVIKCLLSAFNHIANPENLMALNQLVFSYQRDVLGNESYQPHPESDDKPSIEQALLSSLPDTYKAHYRDLSGSPLYDLTENLISIFGLQHLPQFYGYLTAFQDQINMFSQRNPADIIAFSDWFEKKAPKLALPEAADAIVISTLYKAKGLQYRFVFIPFLDWEINSMRFSTNLWLKPESPPFNEMPVVMVHYKKEMLTSHFKAAYQNEYYKRQVDMMNMFYVAITRAEEGLWLWLRDVKTKTKSKSKKSYYSYLDELLCDVVDINISEEVESTADFPNWDTLWDSEKNRFTFGEISVNEKKKSDTNAIDLNEYPLNNRGQKLRYHHPDAFINLNQDEIIRNKISFGSIAHEILEQCVSADDLDAAVDNLVRKGRIEKMAAHDLKARLQQAIDMPEVRDWFYGDYQVMVEQEILFPDGSVRKPDRVMIRDNNVIVVDYKFGKKHNQRYEQQVRNYAKSLYEIGYEKVDAYIWYVFESEVLEVR
ncbi:MAG: UvrD-helicase domain-containing protein [Bacteroidota bacterium]|nr:UvrD-helicase domain-containing protein [Bacteroidota bacterium]